MEPASQPLNSTFHSFKLSGKWYASGRGYLSEDVFTTFDPIERRKLIVIDNGGKYPGLSSRGEGYVFVIFGDEALDYGYPLMLYPNTETA